MAIWHDRIARRVWSLVAGGMLAGTSVVAQPVSTPASRGDSDPAPDSAEYVTDYPAAEVRMVPGAFARLVYARGVERQAERVLESRIADARRSFEQSPDLKKALAEETAAYDALEAARERARKPLESNDSYRTALLLKRDAARRVEELRREPRPDPGRILAAATAKMNYAATARDMETALINADPDVKQARARLVAAANRVRELNNGFDQRARADQDIATARQDLARARLNHVAADAYYQAAVDARNLSLDYAYYLHRYPFPPVQGVYSDYPYWR